MNLNICNRRTLMSLVHSTTNKPVLRSKCSAADVVSYCVADYPEAKHIGMHIHSNIRNRVTYFRFCQHCAMTERFIRSNIYDDRSRRFATARTETL